LTNDQGSEFKAFQATARALKTKIFFTRLCASWERGTVENTNGLLLRNTGLLCPNEVHFEKLPGWNPPLAHENNIAYFVDRSPDLE